MHAPVCLSVCLSRKIEALTLSVAGLLELARPCSISGAVNVDTSSVRPQFLNAKVPVADSSREAGLMMLDMLFRPGQKEHIIRRLSL